MANRFFNGNKKKNNFHQNIALVRQKLQKITNGNTTLDKESNAELIKAAFKEFHKQQEDISKISSNNLTITKLGNEKLRKEINNLKKKVSSFLEMFSTIKFQKLNSTFASLKGKLRKLRKILHSTKMKFPIKDFFSKCDQIRSFLWIWSHLLKKSLKENSIFLQCNIHE